MTVDIDAIRRHIGTKMIEEDIATSSPPRCMIATFNRYEPAPKAGERIAPGWHLGYFMQATPPAVLAEDGLPTTWGVLPKMPFPRRMYAGSSIHFHDDLRVGDAITRETEFTGADVRKGSTGPLIFTTQARRIYTRRGLAIVEESHTVFREDVKAGEKNATPKRDAPPAGLPWSRTITADPVSLFRYSALTFNPHRIHYDRTYAMTVEGYPGLVVHGPYSQQCLIDLARDNAGGRRITRYSQRARAPLFDIAPFSVVGGPSEDGKGAKLWAVTPEGTIAMEATVAYG
ncbi:MAG TPA: MaoC family dehydratase N-terminal domain-containing protein [Hyphomicrobiaceae bacterium]|nr:MaoC family dehydratase N-terminal domain-containing protein [Hyphomicrobiaceae bacterium]